MRLVSPQEQGEGASFIRATGRRRLWLLGVVAGMRVRVVSHVALGEENADTAAASANAIATVAQAEPGARSRALGYLANALCWRPSSTRRRFHLPAGATPFRVLLKPYGFTRCGTHQGRTRRLKPRKPLNPPCTDPSYEVPHTVPVSMLKPHKAYSFVFTKFTPGKDYRSAHQVTSGHRMACRMVTCSSFEAYLSARSSCCTAASATSRSARSSSEA